MDLRLLHITTLNDWVKPSSDCVRTKPQKPAGAQKQRTPRRTKAAPVNTANKKAVLAALKQHGPLSPGRIQELCSLDKKAAQRAYGELLEEGAVQAVGNRRARLIGLPEHDLQERKAA